MCWRIYNQNTPGVNLREPNATTTLLVNASNQYPTFDQCCTRFFDVFLNIIRHLSRATLTTSQPHHNPHYYLSAYQSCPSCPKTITASSNHPLCLSYYVRCTTLVMPLNTVLGMVSYSAHIGNSAIKKYRRNIDVGVRT